MAKMTDRMKSILSRVLSQEIAHQEIWQQQDLERFGKEMAGRQEAINDIKQYMSQNGIEFNYEWYIQEF